MHVGALLQEVGDCRDIADGRRGIEVGLGEVRLLGEELSCPVTPRRMIAVEPGDARQAQEPVYIVIGLWFEWPEVGLDRLDVALELLPAREAVTSGEHALRVVQGERGRVGSLFVPLDFGNGARIAGPVG